MREKGSLEVEVVEGEDGSRTNCCCGGRSEPLSGLEQGRGKLVFFVVVDLVELVADGCRGEDGKLSEGGIWQGRRPEFDLLELRWERRERKRNFAIVLVVEGGGTRYLRRRPILCEKRKGR